MAVPDQLIPCSAPVGHQQKLLVHLEYSAFQFSSLFLPDLSWLQSPENTESKFMFAAKAAALG